ncbi:MAG: CHAT domain-containing protein, partial [Acidobacteria bacterium]|nr:CHAT domain-containing protein [Acidobacteriota bacterium]
ALKFPEPIKLPEAQKLLDERSAMLAFSLGEQESFLFAVTSNDYKVFKLKPAAEIRRQVDDLLGAIHGKGRANSPMGTFKSSARELYQSLIEPAKEMLAGKSELIVVADESLHRLPFEVLLTTQPEGKWEQLPYLVRDFAISYAPSVSVLAFLKTQPKHTTPKDFIAFGDPIIGKDDQLNDQAKMLASSATRSLAIKPERFGFWRKVFGSSTRGASTGTLKFDRLPFSRDEATEIAKLFPAGKADLFLDKNATEENAKTKDLLGQYGIVHFSTHGLPHEDRPRFSSLIMSSPAKAKQDTATIEDGWLSAYEIFNLKLKANLVVLSACETGLGKEVKGEGLMSLTRAFMYAGAPSVVVSLWKVNDAASKDLMVAFYRQLRGGEKLSYSEALRRAQLEMIGKGNAPKFWAPFVLVGKP